MYVDVYLADEHAAHAQREQATAASHHRLVRLAGQVERCAAVPGSLVGRLTAALRPASEPCRCNG